MRRRNLMGVGAVLLALIATTGCKSEKKTITVASNGEIPAYVQAPANIGSKNKRMLPKATAFRMSGDYADKVAVTLNAAGELAYYPAPTDITASSEPTAIADGWYLNRQGVSPNSVFTKYTFAEYRALKQVPTPEEIKAAIIPGAKVTEFMTLPITANEARELKPEQLKDYLK